MASRAMVKPMVVHPALGLLLAPSGGAPSSDAFGLGHFSAVVVTARAAHVMGPFQLTAIGAFPIGAGLKGMVGAAFVAPRLGNF